MSVEKVLAVMSASDKPLTAGKIAVRCAWEVKK